MNNFLYNDKLSSIYKYMYTNKKQESAQQMFKIESFFNSTNISCRAIAEIY